MRVGQIAGRASVLATLCLGCLAATLTGPFQSYPGPATSRAAVVLGAARPAVAAPVAAAAVAARVTKQVPPVLARTQRAVVRLWTAGGMREFLDVAPAGRTRPLPLVVVLHGRRQTVWRAERAQQWDRLAARRQAVVAYGAGYAGSWNAGTCCGPAARRHLDDSAYVLRIIRAEERRHHVDRSRVFVVGFSNGGMLALRFACQHADAVSAFAVVGGSLQSSCRPTRGLSVLAVSGDDDRVVPYGGSAYSRVAGAATTGLRQSLRPWLLRATGRTAVVVVRLPRVGHEWPTARHGGWDATAQIWRFLQSHPMPTT